MVTAGAVVFRLRFGFNVIARPDTSFRRWKARSLKKALQHRSIPILLIHSSGDPMIPIMHSRRIAAEAKIYGVPLETYFVDVNMHCGAYDNNPYEYTSVLPRFLAHHLRDDLPELHHKPVE